MTIRLFKVGGHVRDELLGLKSNDIDFAVEASSFNEMHDFVKSTCSKIFLVTPEFLTIRALHRELGAVDFVMCRKDGPSSDGRHPDTIEPGTIFDDLARRDFTINAMAFDENNNLLDPHGGEADLNERKLRCVGITKDRFNEDALRILRAIRFSITKDLLLDSQIFQVFLDHKIWIPRLQAISIDRQREELHKCFAHSTVATMQFLRNIPGHWTHALFENIWLKPTTEKK